MKIQLRNALIFLSRGSIDKCLALRSKADVQLERSILSKMVENNVDSGANLFSSQLKHLQALLSETGNVLQRSFPGKCYQNAVEWFVAAWFSLDELCWECFCSQPTALQPLHSTRGVSHSRREESSG